MNRKTFKRLYHDCRARIFDPVQVAGISIERGDVSRVGPNGRAYCALTIDRALWRVARSIDQQAAIAYERRALVHVRGARKWSSWAKLPG